MDANKLPIAPFMKALLVHPEGNYEKILETQLQSLFISLEVCHNTGLVCKKAQNTKYNIIFVDAETEEPLDLLAKMRTLQPDAYLVLAIDETDSQKIVAGIRSEADAFLIRPFILKDIRSILRKVMNLMLSARRFEEYKQEVDRQLAALSPANQVSSGLSIDSLTGLSNRLAFLELLNSENLKALILVNLDNFSQINLGYGFQFGDEILKAVAKYLQTILPANGTAFRMQGDEFGILIEDPQENQEQLLAEQIHIELPVLNLQVLEIGVKIGCSIGFHKSNNNELYRHTSIAILAARARGRGRIQRYDNTLNYENKQKQNIIWINRLKSAFEEGRIQPWFQPIKSSKTGRITKYECLIRMLSNRGDIISPANFLKPAEMAGLLPLITGAVVESSFPLVNQHGIELSINISDQDFRGLFLVDYLARKIEELQIDAKNITLEILEDPSSGSGDEVLTQIKELKALGFLIALDDFGVNSSNFSRINDYEPDFIKIDGRFIRGIAANKNNQRIVNLIHQVAKGIEASIVAEFVSNKEDHDYLVQQGIEYLQGNYIAAAAPFSASNHLAV